MNKDQQFFDPNRRPSTIMLSTLRKTYFLLCVTGEFSRPVRAVTDAKPESLLKIMPILGKNKRNASYSIPTLHVRKFQYFMKIWRNFARQIRIMSDFIL